MAERLSDLAHCFDALGEGKLPPRHTPQTFAASCAEAARVGARRCRRDARAAQEDDLPKYLRALEPAPGNVFALEIPDDYFEPTAEDQARIKAKLEALLPGCRFLILPPGCTLREAPPAEAPCPAAPVTEEEVEYVNSSAEVRGFRLKMYGLPMNWTDDGPAREVQESPAEEERPTIRFREFL
jgi:hypothetical protein